MRGYEKEILEADLKSEKGIIRELKKLYKESLDQINNNISELMGKYDAEQLQSIIYQLDYQKALKTQINGVLDQLQAKEYEKISDFLTDTYKNGFMGSMYSMNKQGVPLIIPFNQESIINAIVHQSKISETLYKRLGVDTSSLKKRISAEVSRGIANGFSYQDIARNINNTSKIGINNAVRIARTEGHRIQSQAQLDASKEAKKKGADVVKQWDATLDGKTRPSHRKLDGQIREIEDYFEVDGRKAKAPSQFGKPSEDINCRCRLNQRARWGLDEDELETLKQRAEFFELDKTEDFEDFKKKYLKALEQPQVQEIKQPNIQITTDNFPSAFMEKPKTKKNTQLLSDFINSQENANPKVVELYSQMGEMGMGERIDLEIGFGDKNALTTWETLGGVPTRQKLVLQDLTKNNSLGAYQTNLHEIGHLIDSNVTTKGKFFTEKFNGYQDVLNNNADGISDEIKELFDSSKKQYKEIEEKLTNKYRPMLEGIRDDYKKGKYGTFNDYKKAYNKLLKERDTAIDIAKRNIGTNNLQDIYDALSGGTYRDSGIVRYGHGSKYYKSYANRIEEMFANYMTLSVTNPDLIEMLRRDKPEVVSLLEEIVDTMLKGGTK